MPDDEAMYGRTPVFFVSYARQKQSRLGGGPPDDVNRYVKRLFADLTANVVQLVASPPGEDPGYMDMNMESGEAWRHELLRNVGRCQVFVALLTASYIQTSPWCAMEWDLFMKRRTLTADGQAHDGFSVLPVMWAPITPKLPAEVADVQRFMPKDLPGEVGALYREHGVFGLYRSYREQYEAVVWSLAKEVSRLFYSYRVEPLILTDTVGLKRSFRTGE